MQSRSRMSHSQTNSYRRFEVSYQPGLERLEDRTLLSAGDLDPTFGMSGKVTTTFQGALDSQAEVAALQADGKIVVVGRASNSYTTGLGLARYDANGELDATFGDGGLVTPTSTATPLTDARAVVVQSDGKIAVAGSPGNADFNLVRYSANGSLDGSFGNSGAVTAYFSAALSGVALQADGKIIAVGTNTNGLLVVVRYDTNGTLDGTFGTNGIVAGPLGRASSVAIQSDGRILVAGSTGINFLVARYNPDGTLDPTFGTGGIATSSFLARPGLSLISSATAIVVQPDGRILVGGTSNIQIGITSTYFSLARYNNDGTPDTTFGSDGEVISQFLGNLTGLALQSDGQIIAAGSNSDFAGDTFGMLLARFTSVGAPDTTFGMQGTVSNSSAVMPVSVIVQNSGRIVTAGSDTRVSTGVPTGHQFILNGFSSTGASDQTFGTAGQVMTTFTATVGAFVATVLLQLDGKIVVAGSSQSGLALVRYTQAGNFDSTFGSGGRVATPLGPTSLNGEVFSLGALLQPDGKILVIAPSGQLPAGRALLRYNPDGSLDAGFGSGGEVTDNGGLPYGNLLALQPDGKILIAGSKNNALALVRLNSDGSQDTSFVAQLSNVFTNATSAGISGIAFQEDGEIVLSGSAFFPNNPTTKYALLRLNPTGDLDPTLGTGGIVPSNFSGKIHTQPDGRILMLGAAVSSTPVFLLARFDRNGNPDTTFGTGGNTNTTLASDFVLQPDGKILLAGRTAGGQFALTRLDPNGGIDSTFGQGGSATADLMESHPYDPQPVAIALQPDGRIIAAGTANAQQAPAFGLARFLTDNPTSDPNQRFVMQLYLDLLERSADAGGLTTYTIALDEGKLTRLQVVQAILHSPEYFTLEVQGLYGLLLGRPVDSSGVSTWVSFLSQRGTEQQLETLLIGSPEYYRNRGGSTANGFLQSVYGDILQRPIDQSGAQAWTQALDSGVSRTAVAAAILASPESAQIQVQDLYARVLHRPADTSGLSTYTNALQQGMTDDQLLMILPSSQEYFARP